MRRRCILFALSLDFLLATFLYAQPLVPNEFGKTVSGYQDDFDGTALKSNWTPVGAGAEIYTVSDGMLHVATAGGDPNHLLYTLPGYNDTTQEVLARIRFRNFGTGDQARGGLGVGVDADSGQGINFHFRDASSESQVGRHLSFLDDLRAWGPGYGFTWKNDTWYWVRLRQEPNAASQDGSSDVFAKIWLGDGTTPEPAVWQAWDYIPNRSARTGFAGITAGSSGGTSEFDVDYILIQAAGLPSIKASAQAFPLFTPGPVSVTTQPQNQTVAECSPVTFKVAADGTPPYTYQWYRNQSPIPNATNANLTLSSVQAADSGTSFSVVIHNTADSGPSEARSNDALLTVIPHTTAPVLLGAVNAGPDRILVSFSEPIALPGATDIHNYKISKTPVELPILSATLGPDATNVVITTSGQVEEVSYTLTVNNILDQCTGGNRIATDSQATFVSHVFAPADIGNSTPVGTISGKTGGYQISGGGAGIGGTADQFQFASQPRNGDFDVKVRLDSLTANDPWAEAGLMARESSAAGSRFAGVFATPSIAGAFFKSRETTDTAVARAGSFPVNYPETWLRLKRAGNVFTGYASVDGQNWSLLGTDTVAMPSTVSFGYAVSSHQAGQSATAGFLELSDVVGGNVASITIPGEPLSQSNRKTSIVISEIMYHPSKALAGDRELEYIELFNALDTAEDIGGFRIDGSVHFTFPDGTTIPGGGFIVIAKSPADVQSYYGISGVMGPFTDSLPNSDGKVQFRSRAGAVFLEVNYDTQPPWPVSPDGAGHSLVLTRPSYGEDNPKAWSASNAAGGSPGKLEPIGDEPVSPVVINEFLAHTDVPDLDYIELYNPTSQAISLSGTALTDDPATNKFLIPSQTSIPAHGFIVFDQNQLGFSLQASGETIYFRNAKTSRVLDAIRYEGQANGVSFGRWPDGAPTLRALAAKTPGGANSPFAMPSVVINEIMHSPISGNDDDQFVELYNRSQAPVDLGGWKFISGIDFTFPTGTILKTDDYLVVARNAARLQANYKDLDPSKLIGNFSGKLAKKGERLALAMPDLQVSTNSTGVLATNTIFVVANEVTYSSGGAWGTWSDGGGSSLELIDPNSDGSLAANWADSDETSKSTWTTVSVTGRLDNGDVAADQLQVLLQGAGECLIDDVQVLDASGANQIANSTFENGASGWTAEGTEQNSGLEPSQGYNSAQSYHVRAVERGDNQVNRVRVALAAALAANKTGTISAKVKWLRGHPEVLFRLRGKWLEAPCVMDLPVNLGTPGKANSRRLPNAGPAIYEVAHSPVLPAEGQSVVVTARVSDPDGIGSVKLNYRIDPATSYSSIAMKDDGTGGDSVAGDGIYSGTIPGQGTGALVAFYVQTTDQSAGAATSVFPKTAPTAECLVRFGEIDPGGIYPVYRLWMTRATLNTWNSRSKLNNTPLPVTFVLGNQRVIYGAHALYAGSPYIAPGYCGADCGHCGYSVSFPEDDLFLGSNDLVLDWPGGHGGETTGIQEQMAYYIANYMNLPYSHRYFIRLHVNGVTDDQRGTVFEAVNQPDSEFIKAWSPDDSDGDFYKIDRGFEFSNSGGLTADPMATLQSFTTTGGAKKLARYRWNWLKRAADSANNYTNIFNLVDAANATAPEPYTSGLENLVDMDEWMGIFATEHIINNFDSWGHDICKNMYAYKPEGGRWQLYMFDLDWLMLASAGNPKYTASSGQLFSSFDPVVGRMYNYPPFRRAYFRAVLDAVNGPLLAANAEPVMDAKYNSLLANGIRYCDNQALTGPAAVKTWFKARRDYLLAQLATVAADFSVTGSGTIDTGTSPIVLTGKAPVSVKTIRINGIDWPVTWTSVTDWSLSLPVTQPSAQIAIEGVSNQGAVVAGASKVVTVHYTGTGTGQPKIVINEWMASNTSTLADLSSGTPKYDDWFELYNAGTDAADLTGYFLTDTLTNKSQFVIPQGYSIPAGGYLLVWADGEPEQNRAADPALHANFQLSAKGEAIGLFAPDGSQVDAVTFQAQASNVSEGRCPDGGTNIVSMIVPTPGKANDCTPAPGPVLQATMNGAGQVTIAWQTSVGRLYRVEYTDALGNDNAGWTALGADRAGDGVAATMTINAGETVLRFYRVRIVN